MPENKPATLMTPIRVNPNPRLVWFMNYAIEEIAAHPLIDKNEYRDWFKWASSWKEGQRSPADCVWVANRCFQHKENPVSHCLGQLAWAGKEACFNTPTSGWLVVRYIADAMIAFGVAFPQEAPFLLEPPLTQVALDDPLECRTDA